MNNYSTKNQSLNKYFIITLLHKHPAVGYQIEISKYKENQLNQTAKRIEHKNESINYKQKH